MMRKEILDFLAMDPPPTVWSVPFVPTEEERDAVSRKTAAYYGIDLPPQPQPSGRGGRCPSCRRLPGMASDRCRAMGSSPTALELDDCQRIANGKS